VTLFRRRGIELGCLGLGVAVLVGTVWAVGAETLVRDLRALGWGLGLVLLVESLNVALNTLGWALDFPRGERPVGLGRLLAARLAGDSVNYLTPSASVGGELLRVRLLGSHVPSSLRWASVSAAKVGQSLAQAVFILSGLAIVFPTLAMSRGWFERPGAIIAASAVGVVAVAPWVAFVWAVDRGFWTTIQGALGRLRVGWLLPASWADPGRDLDDTLARVGPWRATASLGCFVAAWSVGAAEIYLILRWVGDPVSWRMALALESGSALIDGILFFVPAKIGTQEGGKVALFAALGLNPARGLTLGVVRRIRELTYAGLGLLALGWLTVRSAPDRDRLGVSASPGARSPGRV
jgi:glycosyltransferase 2 family protein